MLKHKLNRFIYKIYYRAKIYFMMRPPSLLGRCFFNFADFACQALSSRRSSDAYSEETLKFKQHYLQMYPNDPLQVVTSAPVAVDSDDHKWPRGALYDNHRNARFNSKIYTYFNNDKDFKLMDLGCSGGAFVRSFLEDGYCAVGLEGSDISKRLGSGEWNIIPKHLFTCDITKPFQVLSSDGQPVRFHCITAWEVLEHIPDVGLDALIKNIINHLEPNGIFVGSVNLQPDGDPLTGAVYHVTLQNKEWWLKRFQAYGLEPVATTIFSKEDFVRGHGQGLKDWDPDDGEGFHLVLKKRAN